MGRSRVRVRAVRGPLAPWGAGFECWLAAPGRGFRVVPLPPVPLRFAANAGSGVFAAGDVRSGASNRVASAVGDGGMVVRYAHEVLAYLHGDLAS